MKNADSPAMPEPIAMTENECLSTSEYYGHNKFSGLTKREMFAMHAMQGLLANSYGDSWSDEQRVSEISRQAVEYTDALLEELS